MEPTEGMTTASVEQQTAKLPSMFFLSAAVGSMALSAGLMLAGRKEVANFVGQWAPTLLIIGIYNKLVKQLGSGPVSTQPHYLRGNGGGTYAHQPA